MQIHKYSGIENAAAALTHDIINALQSGPFHLAIPGGRSVQPMLSELSRELNANPELKQNLFLYWADERCVGPQDPASNFRLAHELLIEPAGLAPHQIFRMKGEQEPAKAASEYDQILKKVVPNLIILGMGEDGHIASLFPGQVYSNAGHFFAEAITASHLKSNQRRITMTLNFMNQATSVIVLAFGESKHPVLQQWLHSKQNGDIPTADEMIPVSCLNWQSRRIHLYTDYLT